MTEVKKSTKEKPKSQKKNKIKDVPLDTSSRIRCYYCKKDIKLKRELATVKIPIVGSKGKVSEINRKVHIRCAEKYFDKIEHEEETLNENTEWEKCYEAFKKVLGVNDGTNLNDHAVRRLIGLYHGEYYGGNKNARNIKGGYSYEEIRLTILYCTGDIRKALSSRYDFKDGDHKVNYVMSILKNNIRHVSEKYRKQQESARKLETIDDSQFDFEANREFLSRSDRTKMSFDKDQMDADIEKEKLEMQELEDLFE